MAPPVAQSAQDAASQTDHLPMQPAQRAKLELRDARARRRAQMVGWLTAPIALASIVSAFSLLRNGPVLVPILALSGCLGIILLWLLISTVCPAHLDRHCPQCDAEELEPLDPSSFQGVVCPACGWQDKERSGYLIAEADGRVDPIAQKNAGVTT